MVDLKVTQEYIDLFAQAWHEENARQDIAKTGDRRRAGLEKVFAAIQRDYRIEPK